MVSCSSSSPPRGGKRRPQPDNHRTQALQRPNECRTLPGRRGACFPRAVAGGFERRLETVFAASYTRAVLTYGLTGSPTRCWRRFDGGRVGAPLYVPLPGFRWLRSGSAVTFCCNLLPRLESPPPARGGCYKRLPSVAFGTQTVTGPAFLLASERRRYRTGVDVDSLIAASIRCLKSSRLAPPLMAWPLMKKNGVPSTPRRLPSWRSWSTCGLKR